MSDLNQTRIWAIALLGVLVLNSLAYSRSYETQSKTRKWLNCLVDWLFTSYTAHSDFTVKVVSDRNPVPDLTLLLEAEETSTDALPNATLKRKTDADGVAAFSGIPPGKYWIRPDGLLPGSTEVIIDPASNKPDDIVLEWPLAAVAVQAVRGKVVSEKRIPLEGVRMELLSVRNSSLIEGTYTDSQGRYELQTPGDGFFALRLTPRGETVEHEDIGIEVRHDSAIARPSTIRLENSDCGLLLSFVSIAHKQH